jgi:predicted transcriptional regulator
MARRSRRYVIRRADQLAALGSPVRWAIAESLSVHGPSSVGELAERLGRAPESLYYHIRALSRVGLVLLDHKRKAARRSEAVYRLVAPRLVVESKQRSAKYAEALADTCATLLRQTERSYRAAAARSGLKVAGAARNVMVRRVTMRLNRKGLLAVNRALADLMVVLDKYKDAKPGDPHAITLVFTPLVGDKAR